MTQILNFFASNYVWFIVGIIIVLLAIIGYYADKTNFGQGKIKELEEKKVKDVNNIRLADAIGSKDSKSTSKVIKQKFDPMTGQPINYVNQFDKSNQNNSVSSSASLGVDNIKENSNMPNLKQDISGNYASNFKIDFQQLSEKQINYLENLSEKNKNLVESNIIEDEPSKLLNDDAINKFNVEFDSLLPKKDLMDSDLLSDIDDLELGKTQRIDFSKVPDLDDLELPKIGNFKQEEQDLWKI